MPAALAVGVGGVTAIYIAMTAAFVYLVAPHEASSASVFAQRAGEAMLGEAGRSVLASVVVLSVLASVLALIIMAPRLYVAMSRDRLFPPSLARVNPVTQSPVRATCLLAIVATAFVFAGTFQQIVAYFMATTLVFVALAAAALLRIRLRAARSAGFSAPGYPVTTILFVVLVVGIVIHVAINRPVQAAAGLAVVLLGLFAYRVFAPTDPNALETSTER
jgi:APA family basic amino acid/polyamine antiporter